MSDATSHRQILRSSAIVGGASVANIAIGILRVKVVASLLGPAGVGLMGLLASVMGTAATVAGLGLGNSGVRQLAASGGNDATLTAVRRALWSASLLLAVGGGAAVWLLRAPISQLVFGDLAHAAQVGWLSLGVALTVLAASRTALLQGTRRIGDLARSSVLGALLGALGGIVVIWIWREQGIVAFVVLGPAMSAFAAQLFARRLPTAANGKGIAELLPQWRSMASLGAVFMATALMTSAGHLAVRAMVTRQLDLESTGYFQAAWAISMQYIGFVLGAMSADYYPRLTASLEQPRVANRIIDEQIEAGLILASPIILAMIAITPQLVALLYSSGFGPTVDILRWQALGDILKIASWPMGFLLIARAERMLFFCTQSLWVVAYVLLVWLGLPKFGLEVTGIAFVACYLLVIPVNLAIIGSLTGFRLGRRSASLLLLMLAAGAVTLWSAREGGSWGAAIGLALAAGAGLHALRYLMAHTPAGGRAAGWLGRLFHRTSGKR
jgi:PST family polysaccharide transporter